MSDTTDKLISVAERIAYALKNEILLRRIKEWRELVNHL